VARRSPVEVPVEVARRSPVEVPVEVARRSPVEVPSEWLVETPSKQRSEFFLFLEFAIFYCTKQKAMLILCTAHQPHLHHLCPA
jgi:hypothetical protein